MHFVFFSHLGFVLTKHLTWFVHFSFNFTILYSSLRGGVTTSPLFPWLLMEIKTRFDKKRTHWHNPIVNESLSHACGGFGIWGCWKRLMMKLSKETIDHQVYRPSCQRMLVLLRRTNLREWSKSIFESMCRWSIVSSFENLPQSECWDHWIHQLEYH